MQRIKIKLMQIIGCSIVSIVLFSASGCSSLKTKLAKPPLKIYILMGQSNMAGRGPLTAENEAWSNPRVKVLTKDLIWVDAHNPLHFDKPSIAGVGPGLSFGIKMAEANPSSEIGLVPTAVGGTSIDSWVPGAKDKATGKFPYDDAVKRITEAMKYGKIKGVIWHQGEADSSPEKARLYLPKLKNLIERIRALVGDEELPFIAGELGLFRNNSVNFNKQLLKLPNEVLFTDVVSAEGLTDKGDNTHFDSSSAKILGERYAKSMLALQKIIPKHY
jgi:hypothetical protein